MSIPWRKICAGCRHLNAQDPRQHCYMFADAPENECMQHTDTMDKAKLEGRTVTKAQLCEVVRDES